MGKPMNRTEGNTAALMTWEKITCKKNIGQTAHLFIQINGKRGWGRTCCVCPGQTRFLIWIFGVWILDLVFCVLDCEKPASEKPVSEKPVSEKPVFDLFLETNFWRTYIWKTNIWKTCPVSEKPVSEKPVSEKPVSEKPVSKKPVSPKTSIWKTCVCWRPESEKPVSWKSCIWKTTISKNQYLKNLCLIKTWI